METDPVRLKSNEFWGKRSGGYDSRVPKGLKEAVGPCFKQRQMTCGRNNNQGRIKSPWKILAENAIAMGWYNGKRIGSLPAMPK